MFNFLINLFSTTKKEKTVCHCGEHEKCVIKTRVTENGTMFFENKDFFRCGKIKNDIKRFKKIHKKWEKPEQM